MKNKASLRKWSTPRLQEELIITRNRIENLKFCSVNDVRFQTALAGELERRATMLRKTTPTERFNMGLRQIQEVIL